MLPLPTPGSPPRSDREHYQATVAEIHTYTQLHLAGCLPGDPLREVLIAALRCFTAAPQVGDDAGNWLDDLRAGHLNYVAARRSSRTSRRC